MTPCGTTCAVTRRTIASLAKTCPRATAGGPRVLQSCGRRSSGRLPAGGIHSIGSTESSARILRSLADDGGQECGHRCRSNAETSKSTRADGRPRPTGLADSLRNNDRKHLHNRPDRGGAANARRSDTRCCGGPSLERHDISPDCRRPESLFGDGTSTVRSRSRTTACSDRAELSTGT